MMIIGLSAQRASFSHGLRCSTRRHLFRIGNVPYELINGTPRRENAIRHPAGSRLSLRKVPFIFSKDSFITFPLRFLYTLNTRL